MSYTMLVSNKFSCIKIHGIDNKTMDVIKRDGVVEKMHFYEKEYFKSDFFIGNTKVKSYLYSYKMYFKSLLEPVLLSSMLVLKESKLSINERYISPKNIKWL